MANQPDASFMIFNGVRSPVGGGCVRVITRNDPGKSWKYLFVSAGSASDDGSYFNIDCVQLRDGVTLKTLDGARLHVGWGEAHADDTLTDCDGEGLEASAWTVKVDGSDDEQLWMFHELTLDFQHIGENTCRVRLHAVLNNLDSDEQCEAEAEFTAEGSEESEGPLRPAAG